MFCYGLGVLEKHIYWIIAICCLNCGMPRLTLDVRLRAIGMLQGGVTQGDVANRFGVHRHIVRSLWTRYQDTGLALDRSHSGRPCVTSHRQDIYNRVVHLRNRYQIAEATAGASPDCAVSVGQTVRNHLHGHGIRCGTPWVRPLLLPRHRRAWLPWSQNHQRWRLGICTLHRWFAFSSWWLWRTTKGLSSYWETLPGRLRLPTTSIRWWQYHGIRGITAHGRFPLVILEDNLNGHRYWDEVLRQHILRSGAYHDVAAR